MYGIVKWRKDRYAVISVLVTEVCVVIVSWVKRPSRHRWSGSVFVMQVVVMFKSVCWVSISGDHVGE